MLYFESFEVGGLNHRFTWMKLKPINYPEYQVSNRTLKAETALLRRDPQAQSLRTESGQLQEACSGELLVGKGQFFGLILDSGSIWITRTHPLLRAIASTR